MGVSFSDCFPIGIVVVLLLPKTKLS